MKFKESILKQTFTQSLSSSQFWCYLEQGVVYEDVLVLGLHHVVPLRP